MHLTGLDHFFWAAGLMGNTALLFVLWRGRRVPMFPFFTALFALAVFKTAVLFAVLRYCADSYYFYAYWVFTLFDMALQLCVVYELTALVFRPLRSWVYERKRAAFWIIALCLVVAGILTSMAAPPAHTWMHSVATKGNLFAATLMSELFVAVMVLSVEARLPWRTHVARIAQGMGAYSLVSVLIETGHTYFGVGEEIPAFLLLSHVRMTLYLGCVLYWIVTLSRDQLPSPAMPGALREKLFTLQSRVDYDLEVLRSRDKL